jgi:lysozyme
VQPPRKPWWQQATALVSLGTGGAITGFAFAHGTPAHLASPASVPVTLTALDQAAQPGSGQGASDESVVRSAIVKVASYYAKLAETKSPAEMEGLIWQQDSTDGADHGQSCAAFASMTLQLGAQLAGKESWVTGGSTYPWPLHDWVDARVDPNSDSLSITSIVQDAEAHQRWHPLGSSYQPLPGDWVLFDNHVEVVTGYSGGVLSTIGGDSLPNFSVNAHEYSGSLGSEGVQGFVSNGDLPTASTAAAKTRRAGASSTSTSPASRGKTAAGSAAATRQATPATPQDDQQAEEALAAIPGTLAAQPGSRSAGSAESGSASAEASSVAAAIPGVPAGSAASSAASSSSASSAAAGSGDASSGPAASAAASSTAASSSPAASSPAASSPAASSLGSSSSGTSSPATPKSGGRAKASTQPVTEPSASIPGLPIPKASAASSSKATSSSSSAAGSSPYARHQTSASAATATPGSAAQRAFINQIAPGAIAAQQTYGVPAAVTIAQAIDESGWGQSALASEDYNLFGIKGTGPAGSVALPTQEVYDGQTVNITADFRVYHDVAESIDDHGKLLAESGSYSAAMASKQSPNSFANALTGVYATDPAYGSSLINLMRQYNLYRYDASATSSSSTPAASGAAGSSSASAAASPKSRPHGATQSHPASRARTTTRPTAKATSPSLAAPSGSSSARASTPPATTAPAAATTAPMPATSGSGSSVGSSGASTAPDAGSPAATAPAPVASANTPGSGHGTGTAGSASAGNAGSTVGTGNTAGTSGSAGTSGNAGTSGDAGSSTTLGGAGTSGAATSGGAAASPDQAQIPGIPAAASSGASTTGGPGGGQGSPAEASTSAAVSSAAPVTDAELTAVYQPAPKAPAARKAAKRKVPGPKARRAAPRYQPELPTPVKNALLSSARKPLSRAEYVYRDVAASAGLSWKILAACDWMQCDAHPRYSPVQGEKLGTVNPDGTVFFTKSEALTQSAHDLITLAGAVYDIDLAAPMALSVLELANVFAAYRWGGLLRQHSTSAMEFPYSVQGLTDQFMHMRWPKIADPNAPDKPGSKYRRAFGAVPVVLSLDYPAIVL